MTMLALSIAGGVHGSAARADGAAGKGVAAAAAPASGSDRGDANARPLSAHLQITFAGKDAFRENLLLRGAMFYEAVERPDLAARYRELEFRRNLIGALGGAALGVGAVWGATDLTIAKTDPRAHHSATVIPWTIAVAGLVALVVAVALPGEPVSEAKRQALARAHNERIAASPSAAPANVAP